MSARTATRIAVTLATAAALVVTGLHLGSSLPSLGQIGHPDLPWLTIAIVAEAASLLAYALLVRKLLAAAGVASRTPALLRATVSGIAMMATLPAGAALSGTYWYQQLRRQGAERGLAALVLGTTTIAGLLSLTGILIVGVGAAGDAGPLASVRVPIIATALVLMAARIALHRPLVRLANKAFRRFAPTAGVVSEFGQRSLLSVAALAYVNWLLDCASLVAALAAMHASVPAQSVLLTYALAQMVASLPLLPGGGGTVELSLLAGFAAFGDASSEMIAGVILYRLISCWGLVPIGWLAVVLDSGRVTVCRPRTALGSPRPVGRRVAHGGHQHSWTREQLRHAA